VPGGSPAPTATQTILSCFSKCALYHILRAHSSAQALLAPVSMHIEFLYTAVALTRVHTLQHVCVDVD
jgi:hypothetical protein